MRLETRTMNKYIFTAYMVAAVGFIGMLYLGMYLDHRADVVCVRHGYSNANSQWTYSGDVWCRSGYGKDEKFVLIKEN